MKVFGEFKKAGLALSVGDKYAYTAELSGSGVIEEITEELIHGTCEDFTIDWFDDNVEITEFAWRASTGEKPSFEGLIDVVIDGEVYEMEASSLYLFAGRTGSGVTKWRPSLNQGEQVSAMKLSHSLVGDIVKPMQLDVNMKTVIDAVNYYEGEYPAATDVSPEEWDRAIVFNCIELEVYDGGVGCYYPFSVICTIEEFNQCVAEMSEAKWIPEKVSKPTYTKAMQEAGELPPARSEYLDEDGQLCMCIGYSSEKGFVIGQMLEHPSSNGYPPISTSEKTCVNPIQTEREKAIEEMIGEFANKNCLCISDFQAGMLYDAGYRKC